jgi:hypothetical protein
MPSCWEDWTSKCHPWLRQRDSSCRRGCSITVSGVARGCNNGSCTWATHHPKKKISGIVNCSTIYLHVNPKPKTLNPPTDSKMWSLEEERYGSNIHTFLEEKKTFYLPNSLNVKICIQKNGCC